ncbi:MAG: matrixin family metalloprotease [Pseudomonadota bacterium]
MPVPTLLSILASTAFVAVIVPAVAVARVPPVAPVAVEGTVLDRRSAWEGGFIVTRSMVQVNRVMRGTAPDLIEVSVLGGRVGDMAQIVHGRAAMPAGPGVALELWPVGPTWKLGNVLVPRAAGDDTTEVVAIGATNYVRATNKDSDPPCDGALKYVFWNIADVHWVLDDACSRDIADTDACEAAVKASFQTWEDVSCSYIAFPYDGRLADAPLGYESKGTNLNVVKWIETDWPGQPDAQAITLSTVGCMTGRQYDADILINGENSTFTVTPALGAGEVDIQNTVTHEAGHLAGFAHSSDPESTMFYTASIDETTKRDLTADDEQGLCAVYPLGQEPGRRDQGCGCRAAGPPDGAGALSVGAVLMGWLVFTGLARRRRPVIRPQARLKS